jgi:hypothetical protein
MKSFYFKSFFFYRIILSAFFTFLCVFSIHAHNLKSPFYKDIFVVINSSSARLQNIFSLIEKQTPFSFVYDENDINLSQEINLERGRQPLKDVLDDISKQAGLHFIEKKNIILVNSSPAVIKNAVFKIAQVPITGIVQDVSGAPLAGVTVSLQGSTIAVQTNSEGKFSIDVPDNAVLIFTAVGYKTQKVGVNGQALLNIVMETTNKELNEVVIPR